MVLLLTEKKKRKKYKRKTRFAGWGFQVFVVGWETEAEMNFIFGYFNMIELPFVNFRLQPEAWKRYQGWKVNLGAIYFRRIKAFSAPKGKRTISLLKLQPFSFFKMGLTSQGRDSGDTIRHRLSTGQALNVVLYMYYLILFSSPQPCKERVISPFYKSQRSWLDSTRSYSSYTAELEVKWDSQMQSCLRCSHGARSTGLAQWFTSRPRSEQFFKPLVFKHRPILRPGMGLPIFQLLISPKCLENSSVTGIWPW